MSKNVIFCADGTWNGPGEGDNDDKNGHATNVFKLFLNLDGADTAETCRLEKEQERRLAAGDGTVQQIAKYLHGVGDSDNFLVRALGGSLGAGLITRIVRGYTFVSRNYQTGDRIFLLGFSRGAYTARALAGLISAKGLLDSTTLDKETAYRLGAAVWFDYRRDILRAHPDRLAHLGDTILDFPVFVIKPPPKDKLVAAPIEAVAVWDTVGALGVPLFNEHLTRVDVFQFADLNLSANVKHGFHAIAVDEQRLDFVPSLWVRDQARVVQVLFPGAHADVGGGYPLANAESGLSDGALQWMMNRLAELGVRFAASPVFVPKPDATGAAHRPWAHGAFSALPHRERTFPAGLQLSRGVLERMAGSGVVADPGLASAPYAPVNLKDYLAGTTAAAGVVVD